MTTRRWASLDFTNSDTFDIEGTIYSDSALTSTYDISSATCTFRLIDPKTGNAIYENQTDMVVSAGSGVFKLRPAQGRTPMRTGSFLVRVKVEISGTQVTAVGVNGSDRFFIDDN